jgi:hypothetical protein
MRRGGDRDAEQNPYRSPECLDAAPRGGAPRPRALDLAQVGLFLGLAHGAAAGAAATVCLEMVASAVELAAGRETETTLDSLGRELTALVAIAMLGALIGAASGANLGFLQGIWTARAPAGRSGPLVRRAAFCWASVAVAWCLLIDLQTPAQGPRWLMYLALLVAPTAAGFAAAHVAVRLVRLRPVPERPEESTGQKAAEDA